MKTRKLVEGMLESACTDNVNFYRQMLEEQDIDAVKDETWRKVILLARALSPEDRETLLTFARQVAVDSISTLCGGIDGVTELGGKFMSLSLIDIEGQQHAGSLQDEFLSIAN